MESKHALNNKRGPSSNAGPILALVSSALFGVSPVFAKLIIGDMSPALLAGLLYLGSGIALLGILIFQRKPIISELRRLSKAHRWKLCGAIVAGGILAPLCLAYAIQKGSAFEVSLLLNLESVTTSVLAWLVFREHVGRSVWIGKILLVIGGIIIAVNPNNEMGISASSLLVIWACVFWGIDNNLTRDIDELPPTVLAAVKGLTAGVFNLLLALSIQRGGATIPQIGGTMLIGALSYGVSLVLFIEALRFIGASRTSTYFAIGPFFGMLFSLILLKDRPYPHQWASAFVMAAGLWVLYKETHDHEHEHDAITHRHKHVHDEHHRHNHENGDLIESHEHEHTHDPCRHSHPHYPDIHHRHSH